MKKVYILTIEYDDETDEIEYIQEEIIDDTPSVDTYGEVDIYEYFDEESISWINDKYTIGIS